MSKTTENALCELMDFNMQINLDKDELTNTYSRAERLTDIAVRLMKAQGADKESIKNCVNSICEQYFVPDEKAKQFIKKI